MPVLIIVSLAVLGGVGYLLYEEYQKTRWSSEEDAVRRFWRNVVLGIIAVGGLSFGLIYWLESNRSQGGYHNYKDGREQIQYQGSREQQQDINAIDRYSDTHGDF